MIELSPARVLGRFAAQTARADLAPATAEKALTCVLDALGLAMSARTEHTYLALRQVLGDIQSRGRNITLWDDGSPGNLRDALIVNAWLAHAEFHDDGEHGSWTHPGSLVVPAAVSLGESLDAPLSKVMAAVAAGYGTLIWLGAKQKVAWGMINRGFRTSAVLGRIGAAVSASVLLDLDEGQAAHAVAMAAGTTGGTLETVRAGSDEFRLQNALAVHAGVMSAQLARLGVQGSEEAFEGAKGFLRAFAGMESIPDEWREPPTVEGVFGAVVKPWAVLGHSRGPVGAAQLIVEEYGGQIDCEKIAHVRVRMCKKYADYPSTLYRGPFDRIIQALGSMSFLTAAMLKHGELEYDVARDHRADRGILDLAEKIEIVPDASYSELQAIVTVTMGDGTVFEKSSAEVPRTVYYHDQARSIEVFEKRARRVGMREGAGARWAGELFGKVAGGSADTVASVLKQLHAGAGGGK
jgi:2-methylcitrate dehydratase PrpD